MPTLRSSKFASLGLLLGIGLAIVVYFFQSYNVQMLVYSRYNFLINPLQLYELAWIMATIDLLLNFSFQFSLLLWLSLAILVALCFRRLALTVSTLIVAMLLPAGTWLLFAIKYFYLPPFFPLFLLSFLFWQILVPLGITLGLSALVTLPFTFYRKQKPSIPKMPSTIQSICSNCGAVYRSQPLICVHCGSEGTMRVEAQHES
jgi:hypothetical protein